MLTVATQPGTYEQFIEAKVAFDETFGYDVADTDLNRILLPHQRDIVRWAVKGGRRAIFAAFGLGKSVMQLESLRLILDRDGQSGRALIVCPLGVRIEFAHDAQMLGTATRFVRRTEEVAGPGIYITNYESVRDGKLDVGLFRAVSLDEASVLRSYGSKTYQEFLGLFRDVPYRFVATATPSPNRYKELIHYAGFLGIMDTGQALTRWFKRDSTKANNLTLHPHKEREFWLWLASWAVFVQSPADLGRDAAGYDLPPLNVVWHEVDPALDDEPAVDRDGQAHLVRGVALGLQAAAVEKRRSLPVRRDKLMAIVREHSTGGPAAGQIILWCDLNDERIVRRFSSPGELVHDPFAGVGTVPLVALQMGRRGSGAELNPGYWRDGIGYLKAEEDRQSAPTLFDLLDGGAALEPPKPSRTKGIHP